MASAQDLLILALYGLLLELPAGCHATDTRQPRLRLSHKGPPEYNGKSKVPFTASVQVCTGGLKPQRCQQSDACQASWPWHDVQTACVAYSCKTWITRIAKK